MQSLTDFGYLGLLVASFLAATILPLSSEVVLSSLLLAGLNPTVLVVIATIGNVLGAMVNYALGFWVNQKGLKKWLKMSDADLKKAEARYEKYGLAALFFAWVPIIGDPLTVIAGVLRIRFLWFALIVSAGKLIRYVVVSYLVLAAAS